MPGAMQDKWAWLFAKTEFPRGKAPPGKPADPTFGARAMDQTTGTLRPAVQLVPELSVPRSAELKPETDPVSSAFQSEVDIEFVLQPRSIPEVKHWILKYTLQNTGASPIELAPAQMRFAVREEANEGADLMGTSNMVVDWLFGSAETQPDTADLHGQMAGFDPATMRGVSLAAGEVRDFYQRLRFGGFADQADLSPLKLANLKKAYHFHLLTNAKGCAASGTLADLSYVANSMRLYPHTVDLIPEARRDQVAAWNGTHALRYSQVHEHEEVVTVTAGETVEVNPELGDVRVAGFWFGLTSTGASDIDPSTVATNGRWIGQDTRISLQDVEGNTRLTYDVGELAFRATPAMWSNQTITKLQTALSANDATRYYWVWFPLGTDPLRAWDRGDQDGGVVPFDKGYSLHVNFDSGLSGDYRFAMKFVQIYETTMEKGLLSGRTPVWHRRG